MAPTSFLPISLAIAALLASLGCANNRSAVKTSRNAERSEHRRVYFDFNQADVREEDRSVIEEVARWLKTDEKSMTLLEGHADRIGDSQYNEVLSENRARSVRVLLRDQGADPRRITITSKGERQPLTKGKSRQDLREDRRVEIFMNLTKEDQ